MRNQLELENLINESIRSEHPQQERIDELVRKAQQNRIKLEKSIESLQESFDYLRVCIKYQCFDLEATKRENQYLRGLLDEKNN